MKYDSYILERDIFGHTKHLFYLCGYVKKENSCYRIASYSLKTDKLMIKCASEHLPNQEILQDLIKYANRCKYQDVKHLIKEELEYEY